MKAYRLEVDKDVKNVFLDNDDEDNKIIVILDNIQMIYPELNRSYGHKLSSS